MFSYYLFITWKLNVLEHPLNDIPGRLVALFSLAAPLVAPTLASLLPCRLAEVWFVGAELCVCGLLWRALDWGWERSDSLNSNWACRESCTRRGRESGGNVGGLALAACFRRRALCRTWAHRESGSESGREHDLDGDSDHGSEVSGEREDGGSSDWHGADWRTMLDAAVTESGVHLCIRGQLC